jgi:hypothetical protein
MNAVELTNTDTPERLAASTQRNSLSKAIVAELQVMVEVLSGTTHTLMLNMGAEGEMAAGM